MAKFVKKAKITEDVVSVMELPQSPTALGVRTRAKTLALQPNPDLCYLQLRSRRLQKPQFLLPSPRRSPAPSPAPSIARSKKETTEDSDFGAIEASFGDNSLELHQPGRGTRESTPCSVIRDLSSIGTPGSSVRSTYTGAMNQRQSQNFVQRTNPSEREIEDFFTSAEMQQQKHFTDKYNFDVVNDLPLAGRYEWVRIDP